MVSRVLWVLQEDFHILKIERKASITKNHHKVTERRKKIYYVSQLSTIERILFSFIAAAIVPTLNDAIYERTTDLFDLQCIARKLVRV